MGSNHPVDRYGRVIPDGSWPPGRESPGPLETVRRFVNTRNPESGADRFESVDDLVEWMGSEGYPTVPSPTTAELDTVRRLRDSLRDLASANRTRATDHGAWAALDEVAAGLDVRVRFEPVERLATAPGARPAEVLLVTVVAGVHDALLTGTWSRLKSCANDHCRWLFHDHSKNASGNWCSSTACGSRIKARNYRARRA